jgi:hypothetical protein
VAAVQGNPAGTVGLGGEEGGGGDELLEVEEPQDGRCSMELAVAAAEARGGQDAAPRLTDSGGADEPCRLLGPKAEEDLLDELVHQDRQRRRRRHCAAEARVLVGDGDEVCVCFFFFIDIKLCVCYCYIWCGSASLGWLKEKKKENGSREFFVQHIICSLCEMEISFFANNRNIFMSHGTLSLLSVNQYLHFFSCHVFFLGIKAKCFWLPIYSFQKIMKINVHIVNNVTYKHVNFF